VNLGRLAATGKRRGRERVSWRASAERTYIGNKESFGASTDEARETKAGDGERVWICKHSSKDKVVTRVSIAEWFDDEIVRHYRKWWDR